MSQKLTHQNKTKSKKDYIMSIKAIIRRAVAAKLEARVKRLIEIRKPLVVGITGSVGKTTTKLAVAKVLEAKYKVLAHEGNYNTELGLPLSIFGLEVPTQLGNPVSWLRIFSKIDRRIANYPYDALVLELAADKPGEIGQFMKYLRPDIGIITAIAPAHIEGFKSIEGVLEEKWKLAVGSKKVLLNAEDKRLMLGKGELEAVETYGLNEGDYYLKTLILDEKTGFKGLLKLKNTGVKVETKLVAKHSLYGVVAAAAVGEIAGVSAEQIKTQIEQIAPFAGRMNPLPGKNGSLILDDTYNSSPQAVIAALDTLYQFKGRKIAVLGNMNELGGFTEEGHRLVGKHSGRVDLLVTIGRQAEDWIAHEAAKLIDTDKIKIFLSPYDAGKYLVGELKAGDTVLVKGSQNGVFAEEAVALMLQNTADRAKLVRQSPTWQKKKRLQFKVK